MSCLGAKAIPNESCVFSRNTIAQIATDYPNNKTCLSGIDVLIYDIIVTYGGLK